jgi:phosphatidylserine/phosphatidylglycerophosphate/cardiolipin synthase-like enzyme
MRQSAKSDDGKLRVIAIAGTRAILIALDMDDGDRTGLKGFAMKTGKAGAPLQWLTGMKVFKSLAPTTVPEGKAMHFTTDKNPIQSFLWSDYEAMPATEYNFEVSAMFGEPGNLEPRHVTTFTIKTEAADDGRHGVWFNRGAIASQAFADQFGNKSLTDADYNDPTNKEVAWLSRGLLEACLQYIDDTPAGDALRIVAYEFTYQRVILALDAALKRGVDVKIVYHDTPANNAAIATAALPAQNKDGEPILFKRTRPQTPHNKFIVRLQGGKTPVSVFTGSTNFTPSGFLGQTNVGHLVTDGGIAATYLKLWDGLKNNPLPAAALATAMELSPDPPNLVGNGVTPIFSKRPNDDMLDWYGDRITDAVTSSMFTGAFSVDPKILAPIATHGPSMRFILLERPPTNEINQAVKDNAADVSVSFGAILGKMQNNQVEKRTGKDADGKPTSKWVPIPTFNIEKWFLDEELERRNGDGFVFFIHTKFLLVDPLSDDPLVCTGSANFSGASLKSNDENMILVRGDTRVADIYATEYDRIFRHFYSRDIANAIAKEGKVVNFALLDETDHWSDEYFAADSPKSHRRLMFFADRTQSWTTKAASDPSPFATTPKPRATAKPAAKKATSGRRKTPAKKTAVKKTAVKKKTAAKKKAAPKRAAATKKSAVKKKKAAVKKARGPKARKR